MSDISALSAVNVGDLARWHNYTQTGWVERTGRVTRKLTPEVWEVCGSFGVKYIDPIACGLEKFEVQK